MASQTQTRDEELDKILNKAFDDIRRRVNTLLAKREKKLVRDMKSSSKKPRDTQKEKHEEKDKKKDKKEREYRRSSSSSSDSESE